VLSDIHIPNHRNRPISIALEKFQELNTNTILLNGDILDNTPFHLKYVAKPPALDDVRRWFDKTEMFLENLRLNFPKARIIWLEGNHDHWFSLYLMKKAPLLFGDKHFSLNERLHLDDYKIEFLQQERYLMAGKLAICHGHHLIRGIFMPVNGARGVYLRAKASCLISHLHVPSEHTENNIHGDIITTWVTGCLCTLTPDYQSMGGKAHHGFATIKTESSGNFHVTNYKIFKGQLL
jgi:predicted phosphodiesterase